MKNGVKISSLISSSLVSLPVVSIVLVLSQLSHCTKLISDYIES